MKELTKGFLMGGFVAIILMLVALWVENPSAKVYDDQSVVLEQVRAEEGNWEYQFYTGSYYRLTVVSNSPLGYSVGDTVQFAGNGHPCGSYTETQERGDFEPIVKKPE